MDNAAEGAHAQRNSLIRETILDILRNSDLHDMTEFRVRASASSRLGIDLTDLGSRMLVRSLVESFLLSDQAAQGGGNAEVTAAPSGVSVINKEDGDDVVCKLAEMRYVSLNRFKGTTLLSIRDHYVKDGRHLPGAKGISLTWEQWSSLKNNLPAIQQAVDKMNSKLSFQPINEDLKDAPEGSTSFVSGLVPLEVKRFDGKNYASWAHQMELFLNQLDVAYVLADPCPTVTVRADSIHNVAFRSNAAELKWLNDDLICRRNILCSLADCLYYRYSQKTKTARDLWEKLRSVYLSEDCKTRRYLVKKYIEFRMTDEKLMSRQAHELNDIADSIVASGLPIDERFHVSVIASKLPASWKDVSSKLVHSDNLSRESLMDQLRTEDELQKQCKFAGPYDHQRAAKPSDNSNGTRNPEDSLRKRASGWGGKQVVCLRCRKRGHLSKQCLG